MYSTTSVITCISCLQTGDKINVTSRVDADWVVGELRGKKGMFPSSFVDSVPENLPQDSQEQNSQSPSKSSDTSKQQSEQPSEAATAPQVSL